MSARSYLSIGDVLTLLRQEFPDITISKIRFLESQGLVNPERTPSGYRKFYEPDVERLRWVLRQQREHFLPLKVIKDRLEDGSATTPPPAKRSSAPAVAAVDEPVQTDNHRREVVAEAVAAGVPSDLEPVLVGHHAGAVATRTADSVRSGSPVSREPVRASQASTPPRAAAIRPGAAEGGPRSTEPLTGVPRALIPVAGPTESRPASTDRSVPKPAPKVAVPVAELPAPTPDKATPPAPVRPGAPAPMASPPGPAPVRNEQPARSVTSPTSPAAPRAASAPGAPPASGRESVVPAMSGTSMTIDELSMATGLTPVVLAQLQEFGLLRPTVVGGSEYFDEQALTVANLAAGFAKFGVEPRHLRIYKHAADREAGFVEQIVMPLVRQRNPEARHRAGQTVEELAQLGQGLRSALLHSALRDILGH